MVKPQRTRIGVYGVVVQNDKILLCRLNEPNNPDHRKWTLPGGGLDFGEDPRTGLKREILEETGCKARLGEILDVNSYSVELEEEALYAVRILFRAHLVSGTPRAEESGSTDACEWFSSKELMGIGLVRLVRQALQFM